MPASEVDFWDGWNSSYRGPAKVVQGSIAEALGGVVLDTVRALNLASPSILEIGCGTGWLAERFAELGPYEGWDISPAAVELARTTFPEGRFAVRDVHQAQPSEHSYEVVVMVDTVAYFRDQDAAMNNVSALVATNGYLVLTTVNPFVYERMSRIGAPGDGQVRNWLTSRQLNALLARHSLEPIESRTFLPDGDRGILRWVNSGKINRPIERIIPAPRLASLKERVGLGQYRLVVSTHSAPRGR